MAIYKAIGLIKCYTLEGNYNTGKYVNVLPPRGKETTTKKANPSPPKYTPAIYEEVSVHRFTFTYRPNEIRDNFSFSFMFQVGRALAPSILDLTDSNPLTRLRNSEFRSLQGLRNSLRNEIDRNVVVPRNSAAMPKVRV